MEEYGGMKEYGAGRRTFIREVVVVRKISSMAKPTGIRLVL